ncbi:YcaO-like family protein [Microbacterium testaceum]|uniref:YcaO-like family protein n=1 Tax=Microbacterium testaceum TaxID=2033 RepID=UPI00342B1C5F
MTPVRLEETHWNRRRPVVATTLTREEERSLAEIESLHSPDGFIRLLTTYFRAASGAHLHTAHGQYFDFDHIVSRVLGVAGLNSGYSSQVYGGGKGLDLPNAYVSAMGEGVERVLGSFAFLQWADRLAYGSRREMQRQGRVCLGADDIPLFSDAQYADPHFLFDRWGDDDHLGWIPGRRLYAGDEVWVPAQLVLFTYYRQPEEPLIGLAPSGGLACHVSTDKAVFHALDELIERDAVNLRWHARVPLDEIVLDVPLRDRRLQRAVDRLHEGVGAPKFFLQNLDFPEFPVITAVQFDEWLPEMTYNAGGGIGPTPDAAMRSALGEYSQSERTLRICQQTDNWQFRASFERLFGIHPDAEPHEFLRFVQAITFYGYPENARRTDWYFRGGGEVRLSELYDIVDRADPDPVARLHSSLQKRGIDPIMFDFSHRDLMQTRIWKSYIPELAQPYPPQTPALGHPRYQTVPVEAGFRAEPVGDDLLSDPLPYP